MVPIAKQPISQHLSPFAQAGPYLPQTPPLADKRTAAALHTPPTAPPDSRPPSDLSDLSPPSPRPTTPPPTAPSPTPSDPSLPPASNLPDLPETLVSHIAALTDAPAAARKALHLTCHPLRRSIASTLTRITLPSTHLFDPSTTWTYPSVAQLRVSCTNDDPPPPSTPHLNLPPHLDRLVIRTSVTCPQQDTLSAIVRASTDLPRLSLTRAASLKSNIEAGPPLETVATHCASTLESLTITGLSISPPAAHTLAALTTLTHLDVKDAHPCESLPALNALFSTLQLMTQLQSIAVEAKTTGHLNILATLPALHTLDLRPLTPACRSGHSLAALAPLTTLRALTLRKFHTTGLPALLASTLLSSLHLHACTVTHQDVASAASFPALASLVLEGCQFAAGTDPFSTGTATFAHSLPAIGSTLQELRINTVPSVTLPHQVLAALTAITALAVDRTDIPSAAANPLLPPQLRNPLLARLTCLHDRDLIAGCRELRYLAQLPCLHTLEVRYIHEGFRARTVDPIHVPEPLAALDTLVIADQPLMWRPEGADPRWPQILGDAAPALRSLSVTLYGAGADKDLEAMVEHLGGLTELKFKGEFSGGLWELTKLRQLQELSVLTWKDHVQEIADVAVKLSWQGLVRLACQKHKVVAREVLARGKWGCTVVSGGKWAEALSRQSSM